MVSKIYQTNIMKKQNVMEKYGFWGNYVILNKEQLAKLNL